MITGLTTIYGNPDILGKNKCSSLVRWRARQEGPWNTLGPLQRSGSLITNTSEDFPLPKSIASQRLLPLHSSSKRFLQAQIAQMLQVDATQTVWLAVRIFHSHMQWFYCQVRDALGMTRTCYIFSYWGVSISWCLSMLKNQRDTGFQQRLAVAPRLHLCFKLGDPVMVKWRVVATKRMSQIYRSHPKLNAIWCHLPLQATSTTLGSADQDDPTCDNMRTSRKTEIWHDLTWIDEICTCQSQL